MTYTLLYSQRDPHYAERHYGMPQASAGSTIGAYGCGITALAQKLTLGGWPTTPLEVQDRLAHGLGYLASGSYNFINWPRVPDLFPQVVYNGRQDWPGGAGPLPERILSQIQARLDRSEPAIVYVDANRYLGGLQQHFVLITGINPQFSWNIVNPWNGKIQDLRAYGETDALAVRGVIMLDLKNIGIAAAGAA